MQTDDTKEADLRYDPWGNERYSENTTPTGYRYTSQRRDETLGLNDYNARYYDPITGRFISADTYVPSQDHTALVVDFHEEIFLRRMQENPNGDDPTIPSMINRYTYVSNNPINITDRTGHEGVRFGTPIFGAVERLTPEEVSQMINDLSILAAAMVALSEDGAILTAIVGLIAEAGLAVLIETGMLASYLASLGIVLSPPVLLALGTILVGLAIIAIALIR